MVWCFFEAPVFSFDIKRLSGKSKVKSEDYWPITGRKRDHIKPHWFCFNGQEKRKLRTLRRYRKTHDSVYSKYESEIITRREGLPLSEPVVEKLDFPPGCLYTNKSSFLRRQLAKIKLWLLMNSRVK